MTLVQLQYVIAIADTGSFNRAAERLYLSQPSLTNAVRELERELGLTLFTRSARGAALTADGESFIPYARSVCEQFQRLQETYGRGGVRKQKFAVSTQHYSFAVKAFVEMARTVDVAQYEFAIRETRTREVIEDVATLRSEIGLLYLCDFNRKALTRLMADRSLSFTPLIECGAFVYLSRFHPLADEAGITLDMLAPYPCLSFEQGSENFYFAEEILSTNAYPRLIHACDRATMLNLMIGLNGYTLCSGIICEELNGGDYRAVPFLGGEGGDVMEIGYITLKNARLSPMGEKYLSEIRKYLAAAAPEA